MTSLSGETLTNRGVRQDFPLRGDVKADSLLLRSRTSDPRSSWVLNNDDSTGNLDISKDGSVALSVSSTGLTLGDGVKLNVDASGANAIAGTATLASGTVTVATTSVTASSVILVSYNEVAGTSGANVEAPSSSIVAGTSFVINGVDTAGAVVATDTSTVNWLILN